MGPLGNEMQLAGLDVLVLEGAGEALDAERHQAVNVRGTQTGLRFRDTQPSKTVGPSPNGQNGGGKGKAKARPGPKGRSKDKQRKRDRGKGKTNMSG